MAEENKNGSEMDDKKPDDETSKGKEEEKGASQQQPTAEELQAELERTRDALKKANAEAASRRKELEKYEQAEQARQEAEMSELEKAQAKLAEAQQRTSEMEAKLVDTVILTEVTVQATQMGFHNPRDAYELMDLAAVTIGDDGGVEGIEKALKALLKERPYLAKAPDKPDVDADKKGADKKGEPDDKQLESIKRRFGL